MTVKQIAEGAFFVTPHFTKNVNSNIPGLIYQSTEVGELD